MKRHPNSPWIWPIWIGTYAYAATVGALRVESGAHFLTDVIAGAAVGITVGWLVPYLHLRDDDNEEPGSALRVSLAPMTVENGLGAVLTVH